MHFEIKRLVFGLGLILAVGSLLGHGVGSETFVRMPNPHRGQQVLSETWMLTGHLQSCVSDYAIHVKSWQERQRTYRLKPVQVTSAGETNCHMLLWFVSNPYQTLKCAPDQLFYVLPRLDSLDHEVGANSLPNYVKYVDEGAAINLGYWAQACTNQAGQVLLRENFDGQGCGIQVTQVDFLAQRLTVCNLDVQDDHTYLVTSHNVVTHNSRLGPDLVHANFTKGCEVAAATGVLASVGAWLSSLGFTSSSSGLCTIGFSTAVSAPVLIAAGTIGVGYMAWQALNWFGSKHVQVSQEFDTCQVHKVWAGFNQPILPCGVVGNQSVEKIVPSCGVKLSDLPHMNDQLAGAKEISVTSCPTSQAQSKGASEPSTVDCSARMGMLAYGARDRNIDDMDASIHSAANSYSEDNRLDGAGTAEENKIISDEKIKKLLGDAIECERVRKDVDQYKKKGGFEKAKEDFHSMGLDNIIEQANDRIIGLLPDGRTVNVRPDSKGNGPTLEIYAGREAVKIKIRY